jgi:branched-chain amino acid aminotransferase
MGMKTERRQVPVSELTEFVEVGACGTAAVISPIAKIFDPSENHVYEYCKDGKPGAVTMKLYNKLVALQYGDEADSFGWITIVD